MQRYRVNYPLLIGLVVGTVVVLGGGFALWKIQQDRNAGRVLARADEAYDAGELLDAAKLYSQFLGIRDGDEEVMVKLANTYADIAEEPNPEPKIIQNALGLLETTVREQPQNQVLRRRLIDMLMKFRQLKPALDHISQLLNQIPGDTELELLRSQCLFASRDPKAVDHAFQLIGYNAPADAFDAAEAKTPSEAIVYSRVASVLKTDRNEQELAERVMDQLVEVNPDDGTAYLHRGRFRLGSGDADEGRADFDKALELSPNDPAVVIAAARNLISEALQLKEEDFESEGEDVNAEKALEAEQDKAFERARKLVTACLADNPDEPGLYQTLATVEVREGDYDGAIKHFDEGIAAVPDQSAQMLWFAKARLQIEQDQLEDAQASLDKMRESALIAEPFIDYLSARMLMTESRWFDAAKEFERLQAFMSKTDTSVELNFLLGLCYEKLGQFEKSLGAYNIALQNDPLNKAAGFGRTRALNAMGQASREADNLSLYALMQDELSKPEEEQDWDSFGKLMDRYVEELELGDAMRAILEGEVRMRRGMYDGARQKLIEAFKLDPNNLAVRRAAVKLFASDPSQGPVKALKLLDKVVADFGDMPILRLERADLLIAINDEALVDQLFALTKGIDEWEQKEKKQLWNGLAEKFARLRDRESQLVSLRKVAEVAPGDLPTLVQMFMMARESNDEAAMKEAQDRILAVVGEKDDPTYQLVESYRLLSLLRREDEDREALLTKATELIDQALASRPDWNQAHLAKATISLLRGDEPAALESFDRAAKVGRPTTVALYQHVKLLSGRGRHRDALKQMEKVPTEARLALLGRDYADSLLAVGRAGDAAAAALKYSEAAASNADAQLWYARFLTRAASSPEFEEDRRNALREQAGEAFREAVDLNPSSSEAWLALVGYLAVTRQTIEAEDAIREAQLVLAEDQTLLMFARCYELVGRWIDAEAYYKQAVEDASEAARARPTRLLASFYLGAGYPRSAKEKTAKATPLINDLLRAAAEGDLDPNDPNARWARSTAARMLALGGEYQMLRDAERLLASNVVNGELPAGDRLLLAEIFSARPEPVSRLKAVQLLSKLRQNQRLALKSEMDLARLYFSLGEWRKCKEQMIDVIARAPDNGSVRYLYLKMLLERGGPNDISQAIPQLRKLTEIAPKDFATREMIARVALKRGKKREAAATLLKALPGNPASIEPEQLGLVKAIAKLLVEFEDFDTAEKLHRLAVDKGGLREKLELAEFMGLHRDVAAGFDLIEPLRGDAPEMLLVQAANKILRKPVSEGDYSEYVATVQGWLDRALREEPDSVPLRLQQADLYDINRQYEESVEIYRELLASNDLKGRGKAVVLNNLAYLLALSGSDPESVREARRLVNQAVDLLGPQTDILDTRAVVSIAAERYDDAIEDLELALIDGPNASKYFHKALAHLLAGQNQEAAEAWQKAIDLGLTRESVSRLEKDQFDTIRNQLEGQVQRSAGV